MRPILNIAAISNTATVEYEYILSSNLLNPVRLMSVSPAHLLNIRETGEGVGDQIFTAGIKDYMQDHHSQGGRRGTYMPTPTGISYHQEEGGYPTLYQ